MEITQEVDFYFDVVCNICGKGLEATIYKDELCIDPCETCLEEARGEEK
jgi:hypothetical protein